MERLAQVVQALATAVRAGRSLSPDQARAALCEVERLIDLLEMRHGVDSPALATALRGLHAALGARADQTALPGQDVAARAAGRRFRATLGRVVAVLAAGAALSAPMAVAAQERVYAGPLPGGVSTGAATGERIVVRDVDGPITPGAGSSGLRTAGDGGTGGDGSNSSVTNTDDGGAGGNGGGGASFEVAIDLQGSSIAARDAAGVLLTARGGAAGDGGYDDAVLSAVGGRGGAGGAGGSINGGFSGDVTVDGAYGPAIRIELNGGDGGSGGDAGAIAARGGVGGAGGNGGSGVFNLAGDLVTRGIGSVGIFATADGGSGGSAGDSDGVGSTDDSDGFGRAGGQGGRGGLLDIDFDGSIQTDGTFASGLAGLSRGGQGGRGGSAGSVNGNVTVAGILSPGASPGTMT
ncbi:MAG: hypothetical protein KKE52_09865, partial [Alphaproteobacteria bacterium]|nr:hypothetical protein [Alphaproteobacteria bacterium]